MAFLKNADMEVLLTHGHHASLFQRHRILMMITIVYRQTT